MNARRAFKTIGAKQLRGGCFSEEKERIAWKEAKDFLAKLATNVWRRAEGAWQGLAGGQTATQIANCNKLEPKWGNDGDNERDDGRFVCVSS